MSALRVALFAPYLPAPAATGGRIRIHRLATALAEIAQVELFAAAVADELRADRAQSALSCYASVHVAPSRFDSLPGALRPARVRAGAPSALAAKFRRAHQKRRFDVIVAEHSHTAAPALELDLPLVLDEHNVESDYLLAREQARGKPGFFLRREIAALRRWERRAWRRATEVVCVSSADADQVNAVRARPAVVIPNGVDLRAVPFRPPSERDGFDVLFVGLMSHAPNVVAARFLALEVMPLVRRDEPRARLVLCGMNPAREVLALSDEHTQVTGFVPSVQPFLEASAVYANPLRHGAGTSLKVLEALAAGLPLVSTAVGVRGFELSGVADYLEAETAIEFAAQINAAFRNRAGLDAGARRGRTFAERHDWTELGRRFGDVVLSASRLR
jgi:glycosyltransferase involved in cell wall biosynthesis